MSRPDYVSKKLTLIIAPNFDALYGWEEGCVLSELDRALRKLFPDEVPIDVFEIRDPKVGEFNSLIVGPMKKQVEGAPDLLSLQIKVGEVIRESNLDMHPGLKPWLRRIAIRVGWTRPSHKVYLDKHPDTIRISNFGLNFPEGEC